jgi:hypothetical protein
MLNIFGGGKPDHPMADLKEARRILEEVPAHDAFKALEELAHWLESVRTVEGFKPDYRLQLVLLVDDAAQVPVRKLQRDYLSSARLSRFQEQRLWNAIHGYWKQSALAFESCVEIFVSGAKGADALKSGLPLLTVRALRSLAAQIKWQYIRYGPFDGSLWGHVARVYAFAEAQKIAGAKAVVQAGLPGESTPEQEFLRAVMLAASSPDSLLPVEMELAERLIAHFSMSFKLAMDQQPDIAYWIDLATDRPPLRLARPPQHAPTLRFFAAGKATQELVEMARSIESSHAMPAGVSLGGTYEPEAVLEVLRHLALYWSSTPPERRHQRHRVKSRLLVAPGFDGIMSVLDPSTTLDFDSNLIENWIVEDVSAGGFGASIPHIKGEWLGIGCLTGLQPEGGDNWVIGIIRRLNRDARQQGSVGIQSLGRTAALVTLRGQNGDETRAILLNPSVTAMEAQLLVRPDVHVAGQTFEFNHGAMTVLLLPSAVQERGGDFELISARQMIRDSSD